MAENTWQFETATVHAGLHPDPATGAIMTPIYQTSTFVLPDIGESKGFDYSRGDNPTRSALQEALATLEGGNYALSFASGMAATDTLLRLVKPGDHVVAGNVLYGGTYRLFQQILTSYGLEFSFVDTTDPQAIEQVSPRGPDRGIEPEQDRGHHDRDAGKAQNRRVHDHRVQPRKIGRAQEAQESDAPHGETYTQYAPEQREGHALG